MKGGGALLRNLAKRIIGFSFKFILLIFFSNSAFAFDPVHVQKFSETGNCENCDLSNVKFSGRKIVDADLSGADLSGADLSDTDLSKTYLSNANLKKANLKGAKLDGTFFYGADLTGADLTGADLHAEFAGADLTDAKMQNAKVRGNFYFAILDNLDVLNEPGFFASDYFGILRGCVFHRLNGIHSIAKCRVENEIWK